MRHWLQFILLLVTASAFANISEPRFFPLTNLTDDAGTVLYGYDGTFATYTYDARNRLQNVGGVTNVYDAANNRIGQFYGTNSIAYVINPNSALPQALMRIKNGITNYYVYGPGLLYQVTEAATGTNTVTYHYDYRGSTIALTGDNGLATDRMEYSLYATMTYHLGTNDTPFLFNGQFGVMSDPNGLLYMRARYYNPFLCRFLNPDPSGFSGGMNLYAYAAGNPVIMTDPTGLGALGGSSFSWVGSIYGSLPTSGGSDATPGDLTDPFGFSGANENSVPDLAATAEPNVFPPPSFISPGSTPPPSNPYLDLSQPTTWNVTSPGDVALQNDINAGVNVVAAGAQIASLVMTDGGSAAESEMVQIFRAVDQDELPSIINGGTYGSSPSMGGKYFALTQEGAQNFANASINAGQQMTITSTTIPRSVFNQGFLFNDVGAQGAGASIHFQQDFLPTLYNSMTPIQIH